MEGEILMVEARVVVLGDEVRNGIEGVTLRIATTKGRGGGTTMTERWEELTRRTIRTLG